MKSNGFTLIELMIVVAIIGILAAIAYPAWMNRSNPNAVRTTAGTIVSACVNGYSYTLDSHGQHVQQFNEQGGGVRCR